MTIRMNVRRGDIYYADLSPVVGSEQGAGIRPMKLLRMLTREYGKEEAERRFMDDYLVSEKKLALSRRTLVGEDKILSLSKDNSFSLYISVPFCPSRCSYCSFVSQSVEHAAKLIPQYTELLVKELKITAEIASSLGLHLESVYMGGGTPTTLSAEQMERVLTATGDYFDLSGVHEFTVEAGRPDTITPEKLAAIKRCGVGRISINPQTLSDDILRSIGRRHTVRQVYEAMDMAKAAGFDNINMDLIAGLQGDTLESYRHTIDGVIALGPSSITVHTLAMKRSASMVTGGNRPVQRRGQPCRADAGLRREAADGERLRPLLSLPAVRHGGQSGKRRLGKAGF